MLWYYSYSSNFLLLEYSLISIYGYKFPFPVAVFCRLQSIDEFLEFMETWGYAISFATCQSVEIDHCTSAYTLTNLTALV